MTTRKIILFSSIMLLFTSCNKLDVVGIIKGQSPTVEERFKQSMEYNAQNPIPDIIASRDDYSIFVCTDLHAEKADRWIRPFVEQVVADETTEPFGLCLGDLVFCTGVQGVVWDAFQPLRDDGYNLFMAIGNHDLYFNEWKEFAKYWHTTAYSFRVVTPSAGTDLYITFDSAEGTLGVSQLEWLRNQLKEAYSQDYRHIILFTHTHFFKRDISQANTSNYNAEETVELLTLFAQYGVDYVLTGHDHYYEHTEYRGVDYYTLNAMSEYDEHASYYRMTLSDNLCLEEIRLDNGDK